MRAPANVLSLASVATVAALGAATLWTPFSIDQTLFAQGAETILSGGTLYLDFWDIKQPGIFLFYALAGKLWALDEVGVHLLELAWMLAAALALVWIGKRHLEHPAAIALAPLAALGVYFVFANGQHRTQVEALLALPLALALAAAIDLTDRPRSAALALTFGVSTAVVGALKLLCLVLPGAFFLLTAATLARTLGRRSLAILLRIAALGLVGVLAVWLPLLAYFAVDSALPELLWTSFGYPTETLQDVASAPIQRLQSSARWALGIYTPWLPLVALGVLGLARSRRGVAALGIALYLVLAGGLICIQKTSWWEYHLVLLFPPLGLLAASGLDTLLEQTRRFGWRDRAVALVAAVLLLPALGSLALGTIERAGRLVEARAVESDASLAIRLDPEYLEIWDGTRFLREGGWPGSLYAFGDPRILRLSGRRQSIPVHGHGWEHLPKSMWERLPGELAAAAPAYVFVTDYNWELLARRAPELREFLELEYRANRRLPRGRLLVRRRASDPSG